MRSLSWRDFKKAVFEAMVTTAAILIIIAGAKIFGKAITLYRIPQDISMLIQTYINSQTLFVVVVCFVLVAMGLVFETLSMVLIMVPVSLPSEGRGQRFESSRVRQSFQSLSWLCPVFFKAQRL